MKLSCTILIFLFLGYSCKPQQEGIEFGITIKPKVGENASTSTKEDHPILIEYEIKEDSESIDLNLKLFERPKFGQLEDCKFISKIKYQCIYVPSENFSGIDTIKFKAVDGDFESDEFSELKIDVIPVPDPPIAAEDFSEKLPENSQKRISLMKASDVDSNELNYEIVNAPTHGVLSNCLLKTNDNVSCDYIPNENFSGLDSFEYKAIDSDGLESEKVTKVNLKVLNYPEIEGDKTVEISDKVASTTFSVIPAIDSDSTQDELQYKIIKNPAAGTLKNCFASRGDLNCEYVSTVGYSGKDEIEYQVIDTDGLSSNTAKIIFRVAIKEAPVPGAPQTINTAQGNPITFEINQATDNDSPLNLLKYTIVAAPKNGGLKDCFAALGNRFCTYTPTRSFYGEDSFTYKVIDETNTSSQNEVTVTIKVKQKISPVASNYTSSIDQYSNIIITVPKAQDSDSTENQLTYKIITQPQHGILTDCFLQIGSRSCKYTPNNKYYGSDSFSYQVQDEFGLTSNIATVSITIKKVDLKPVIGANQSFRLRQGDYIDVQVNPAVDNDSAANLLQYSIVTNPTNGTLSNCFSTKGSLSCRYTPSRLYYGSDSFSYRVTDETGKTSDGIASVSFVIYRREAPIVNSSQISVDQYQSTTFDIIPATDTDSSKENIKYEIVKNPSHGTLSNCFGAFGNISCTYKAEDTFYGSDEFEFKAIDDFNISSSSNGKVAITVKHVNLPPEVGFGQSIVTKEDIPITFTVNSGFDIDTPPNELRYRVVNAPQHGILTNCFQSANKRECTYTPNSRYYGLELITYEVLDSEGLKSTSTQSVSIGIERVQMPPTPGSTLTQDIPSEVSKNITLPLGSDVNESSLNLSYKIKTYPSHGTLSNCNLGVNQSRQCSYKSSTGFYGLDQFTYEVIDSTGLTSVTTGLVKITVLSPPSTGGDLNLSTFANSTISFNLPLGSDPDSLASVLSYSVIPGSIANGVVVCNSIPGDRKCSFSPGANFVGEASFSYTVTDEKGLTAKSSSKVIIKVNAEVLDGREEFTQKDPSNIKGADFLWVVDNSGSMADEQASLANNFNSFIDQVVVDGKAIYPFNMVVVTTDKKLGNSNTLGHTFAEADFTKFKFDFGQEVSVGTNGSASEKVYESAQYAISNLSNFFEITRLAVIITVSDEPEQSTSKSAEGWAQEFQSLKENPQNVVVFNIVSFDSTGRYATVANLTGGKNYSLTSSFSSILSEISATVTSLLDSYALNPTRNIDASSIKVSVEGVLQDASKYTYNNGVLKFITPPAARSSIVITYKYSPKY